MEPQAHIDDKGKGQPFVMDERLREKCELLGFDRLPGELELKRAYKILIKQWHPDRFYGRPELEQLAVKKTQRINLAYKTLLQELTADSPQRGNESKGEYDGNPRHRYSWQKYSEGFPDSSVAEIFLNSSHVFSAGYNKNRWVLYLKFLGDEIFVYFDVPEFIFQHLLLAHSPGKYAMRFIYGRFRHRKVVPLSRSSRLQF